jgi:phenylalanyl-tRNA synthetase beta chain
MRRSLLPGALDTIAKNTRHFREFRFFELGREIHPRTGALPEEKQHLVAVLYNARADEHDFFELKRVAECLFPKLQLNAAAEVNQWEHPFRTAEMHCCDVNFGRIFELHPSLLEAEKVEGRAFLFDVDLDVAEVIAAVPKTYQPLRRFPTSAFDLSVIAPLREPVAKLQTLLSNFGGTAVVSIEFVRQYAGPPLESGQKSVSYRIEVGALDRTITNDDVSDVRTGIIEGMRAAGYDLRL